MEDRDYTKPEGFEIPKDYFSNFSKQLHQRIYNDAKESKILEKTAFSQIDLHTKEATKDIKQSSKQKAISEKALEKLDIAQKYTSYISSIAAALIMGYFYLFGIPKTSNKNILAENSQEKIIQEEILITLLEEEDVLKIDTDNLL